MKVFKFGGASVRDAAGIKNLAGIVSKERTELVIVVSAFGKTTNALEKILKLWLAGDNDYKNHLDTVYSYHSGVAGDLFHSAGFAKTKIDDSFALLKEYLRSSKPREYDYEYDRIVSQGEIWSTIIIAEFLKRSGLDLEWTDIRKSLVTDDRFRDANIIWDESLKRIRTVFDFSVHRIYLTQGFIGATDENESTTLGREGSDYTAAVFANMLDAESQTIWKDVVSVMNADPRQFPDAVALPELNYNEVIEMAYYGAQVIHPKTIKPLQNKGIPLYVKCFLDPALEGTVIHNRSLPALPPVIVLKEKQVLIEMSSRDFSFVGEQHVGQLYHLFEKLHIKPNLTQNGAISFLCVMDDRSDKIEKLALEAAAVLDVQVKKGLSLLTIRHYTLESVEQLIKGKTVLLRQQTPDTVQFLLG